MASSSFWRRSPLGPSPWPGPTSSDLNESAAAVLPRVPSSAVSASRAKLWDDLHRNGLSADVFL